MTSQLDNEQNKHSQLNLTDSAVQEGYAKSNDLEPLFTEMDMSQPGETSIGLKSFDKVAVSRLISELILVLDGLNPDSAEPVLVNLRDYLNEADLAPVLRELELFDFDTVKETLNDLADKKGIEVE